MKCLEFFPAEDQQLRRQFAFLGEGERLKEVLRKTSLLTGARKENSAEHSWHVTLLALILAEHANEPVDLPRVLKMLLLHDLGEIEAGDTFHYEKSAEGAESERIAAERLFALLPDGQRAELAELWREFHEGDSAEARYARAVDRLWPVVQNIEAAGGTWRDHGIDLPRLRESNAHIGEGSARLWRLVETLFAGAADSGMIASGGTR